MFQVHNNHKIMTLNMKFNIFATFPPSTQQRTSTTFLVKIVFLVVVQ